MKQLTLILVFIISLSDHLFSQDLPQIKHKQIEEVVEDINIFKRNNRKTNTIITSSNSGDTLTLDVKGKENAVLKYTFKLPNGRCNFQSVEYDCVACGKNRLENILKQGYFGWRKSGEDKYLSKYLYQTEMEVIKNKDNTIRILYRFVDKTREEYKTWYKTLSQIGH